MASANEEIVAQLSSFLSSTLAAHSDYERDVLKGARDEAWPQWYANYMLGHGLLRLVGDKADSGWAERLDQLLAQADISHRTNAPDERWQDYYARYLLATVSAV